MLHSTKTYHLDQSPFYRLNSKRRLGEILGITDAVLRTLSKGADDLYNEFYTKAHDKKRLIENPKPILKAVQKKISKLLSRLTPPKYLFCPVKGKSYVSNAALHANSKVIKKIDIKKYFPSTTSRKVYWYFHKIMQCSPDVAASIVRLVCYKEHLPTGAPTSPIVSYLAHVDAWEAISKICQTHSIIHSLYVDDLSLSGDKVPDAIVWQIKQQIRKVGLDYHKERAYYDGAAEITGVIVKAGTLLPPNRSRLKAHQARVAIRNGGSILETEGQIKLLAGLEGHLRQIRIAYPPTAPPT